MRPASQKTQPRHPMTVRAVREVEQARLYGPQGGADRYARLGKTRCWGILRQGFPQLPDQVGTFGSSTNGWWPCRPEKTSLNRYCSYADVGPDLVEPSLAGPVSECLASVFRLCRHLIPPATDPCQRDRPCNPLGLQPGFWSGGISRGIGLCPCTLWVCMLARLTVRLAHLVG